jgi:succinylglutamate desuccinylase
MSDHPTPEALANHLRGIADDVHRMVSSQYFSFIQEKLRQAADTLEAQQRQLADLRERMRADETEKWIDLHAKAKADVERLQAERDRLAAALRAFKAWHLRQQSSTPWVASVFNTPEVQAVLPLLAEPAEPHTCRSLPGGGMEIREPAEPEGGTDG